MNRITDEATTDQRNQGWGENCRQARAKMAPPMNMYW